MLDKTAIGDSNNLLAVTMQDFYSVHGENAVFIAHKFYKTTAVVKTMGSGSNNLQGAPPLMRVFHMGVGGTNAIYASAHKLVLMTLQCASRDGLTSVQGSP